MRSFTRLPPFLTTVALFVVGIGEPAAAAEKRLALTLTGMLAPSYSHPTLSDAHSIPKGDALGLGLRLDGRFQLLPWLGIGLGGDYLATSSTRGPVGHLGFPLVVAFTPLRTPRFELGAALGVGPAWGRYENSPYAVGGTTLRSSGTIAELRVEGGFPVASMFSIRTSVGYRRYSESFSNGDGYASGGIEAQATALDFGIGARWHL